jgi:glycosyltransferase involved in cell wall biosynthesis
MLSLSIIIPCYNESKSLPRLFELCKIACLDKDDIEIIFVDNGSIDDSKLVFNQLLGLKDYSFCKLVSIKKNQGYGNGILTGLSYANGQVLAWTHADLQTNPKDIILAYNSFKDDLLNNNCIVKGVRKGRSTIDNFFTIGMSLLCTLILKQKLWDVNAQPKIFHRDFLNNFKNTPKEFSLDLYLLCVANYTNTEIKTIPVTFSRRKYGEAKGGGSLKGKFKLIKRTISFILELKGQILTGKLL